MRGLQSSVVADPTKKSASYVPAQPALLFALKSTDAARGMFPGGTILANPVVRGYVNPRHQGYVSGTSLVALPRITIDLEATDFSVADAAYTYTFTGIPPPGTDFEVAITNAVSPANIRFIFIADTEGRDLLGNVTISTNPEWSVAELVQSANSSYLEDPGDTNVFPGLSTIITFRGVPLVNDLDITFSEN